MAIRSGSTYYIGIRVYHEPMWGWRNMGPGRYALDMGRISILFERI